MTHLETLADSLKNYLSGSIYVLGGGENLKVTMMDAALKYAEANIPVIPLHWICEDGSCSCKTRSDCDSKGKHSLYTGWYNNSTTDVEQIRKWWTNVNVNKNLVLSKVS